MGAWTPNLPLASRLSTPVLGLVFSACLSHQSAHSTHSLRISEVQASNGGVAIDQRGETEDWIELQNVGSEELDLSEYALSDQSGVPASLPARILNPGQVVLLWADDDVTQGDDHLPFKLSAGGDRVVLYRGQVVIDQLRYERMVENESLARLAEAKDFSVCRYPTPGRRNGERCGPPPPPDLTDIEFDPAALPQPYPPAQGELVIAEAALRPAKFVELLNRSPDTLQADDYQLWLAPHAPGVPWPAKGQGVQLALQDSALGSSERLLIDVTEADVAALTLPEFEGVLTLVRRADGTVVDRVDFMRWPLDAALTRTDPDRDRLIFCENRSPGADAACKPLARREVGDRLRHLRTPGDFMALAEGGETVGVASVKSVTDLSAGDVTHLLSARHWPLHYTFVREAIDGDRPLDRCDPAQAAQFQAAWVDFSRKHYFVAEGRRYLLGTFSHFAGADLDTFEFAVGDAISPAQMRHAFERAMRHVGAPERFALRPQDDVQVEKARSLEGQIPIVGPNAPFIGVRFQGLSVGVGYGTLQFIPGAELARATLGPRVIVVTDEVPNDLPFVGGLITEAFQTPLAHVNVLSRGRNTPNMALRDARNDAAVAPYLDTLVRLTVDAGGFRIEPATAEEAEAFYRSRMPQGEVMSPRLDISVRGLVDLDGDVGIEALPSIGAKAAQLGELLRVQGSASECSGPVPGPDQPFAIPLVHSMEHLERSGAAARLAELAAASADERPAILSDMQAAIMATAVDPELLAEVEAAIAARHGKRRVRLRSSSNTEDLPGFNGAGIYTSISAEVDTQDRSVADAMRTVWASLWNPRAYDEREFARIDHSRVAMGILVHNAFLSEQANGVAISRNILEPTRGDQHYLNLQFGEASVTNPAPGVSTEELIYQRPPRTPPFNYQSASSLRPGHVMQDGEISQLSCYLAAIHDHFRALIDPAGDNAWFAVDIEFKLMGEDRKLFIKQARPYSFGAATPIGDCREF